MKLIITTFVAVACALPAGAQQRAGQAAALRHLEQAAQLLDRIPLDKIGEDGDAEDEFKDLQKNFADMVAAYRSNNGVPPPLDVNAANDNKENRPVDWRKKFSEVERKLTALVGGGPAFDGTVTAGVVTPVERPRAPEAAPVAAGTAGSVAAAGQNPQGDGANPGAAGAAPSTPAGAPATVATPGAVGTAGTTGGAGTPGSGGAAVTGAGGNAAATPGPSAATPGAAAEVSTIGIEDLDPAVRQQLHEFRRELELFFVATIGRGGA